MAGQGVQSADPNPTRAGAGWPPAVIAGAWRTGVLGMRSLARRGVRASCFDCNRSYEGFRSIYGPAFACPDPDSDPDGWVAFMIDLAGRIGGTPVLIASADQFVSAIATHAPTLTRHYVISSGAALHAMLATKQTQYQLAARYGMPLPRTRLVQSVDDVAAFAGDAHFPCLLKPLHFREWQRLPEDHPFHDTKVAIASTPEEMVQNYRLATEATPNLMAQEIILGPDTSKRVYLSCYSRRGHRIGHALFRELRCDPVGFGPATVSEPVDDPEADAICDLFLKAVGYSGICEIEAKRDARDGRVKLIEVNPRLTGNGDAAPHAGVDLCWLHYLDAIGQDVTPVGPTRTQFRHVVVEADVAAIINYRRARLLPWRDLVRSYRPPLAFFDLDARDWRYSARTAYRVVRAAVRELLYWILPRARLRQHDSVKRASVLAPNPNVGANRKI